MFKDSFKYYKSKNPAPSLNEVLDFDRPQDFPEKATKISIPNKKSPFFGLKCPSTWDAFSINENPGLIFIRNPFTNLGQRYWAVRCLQDYTKKPNKSNLDALKLVPDDCEWWDECQNNNNLSLMQKMRWITLGYHHNWDTKIYTEDNKNDFPEDLANLTSFMANVLGFTNFNAEAAIVNYYHLDSTLSGHTDHSEMNLEAPLFSLSFGQTAIFLLGGPTKDTKPTAMFLKSGDIVIMSKESRLCYHGVPKILKTKINNSIPKNLDQSDIETEYKPIVKLCIDNLLFKPFGDYLSHSRININVRQVLRRGQKRLNDDS